MKQNKEYRRKYHEDNREYDLAMGKKWYRKNHKERLIQCKKYGHSLKGRFIGYKTGAKRKGLIFEFTLDEFSKIINKSCYYCGEDGYGIDRIDSSVGYLKDNCVSCCSMCNYMKNNYTEEEFIGQCIKIAKHTPKSKIRIA